MATETDICNLALVSLGHQTITSMDEASKGASLCKLRYPICRDMLLAHHPWNFAIRRTVLAKETAVPGHEFEARHTLPNDCLRVWRTNWEADGDTYTEWRVEGGALVCNEDVVRIEYITRVTNAGDFPIWFADLLSAQIAAELAIPMTDNAALAERLQGAAERKLTMCRSQDAQEGKPRMVIDTNDFLNAREGSHMIQWWSGTR